MRCHICGEVMIRGGWYDEAWGTRKRIDEWECTNEYCGEDQCDYCGEYESLCLCGEEEEEWD